MLAYILDICLAYFLFQRATKKLESILIAIFGGVIIAAATTIGVDVFIERMPIESIVQFYLGCIVHPSVILVSIFIYKKIALRKLKVQEAINQDLKKDEADYTAAIQALLIKHEKTLGRQYLIDNDVRERLDQERTDILIDRINSHYFSDDALPAVLHILKSRITSKNETEQ